MFTDSCHYADISKDIYSYFVILFSLIIAKQAMWDRLTPVIIDNTNVQAWEMKPYVMAVS